MSGPTPGPWEINEQYIIARSRRGLRTICQWRSYSDEPDARLIAAAPDLLAALKACEEYFRPMAEDGQYLAQKRIDVIRAALAKAEGTS